MFRTSLLIAFAALTFIPSASLAQKTLEERVTDLEARLDALTDSVNNQLATQQSIIKTQQDLIDNNQLILSNQQKLLSEIASWDGDKKAYLRFDNIMSSSDGRRQIQDAVHGSIRRQGVVTVNNRSMTGQYLWVNRVRYWVAAGGSIHVNVPVGTATTQLPGQNVQSWTITAPNYAQALDLTQTYTYQHPGYSTFPITAFP